MAVTVQFKRGAVLVGCFLGLLVVHILGNAMKGFTRTYDGTVFPAAPPDSPDYDDLLTVDDEDGSSPKFKREETFLDVDFYYFLGGILVPLPMGYLALNFSAGFLFGALVLMQCILNLLVATAVEYGSFFLLRCVGFTEGAVESSLVPVVFVLLVKWTTDKFRTCQVSTVMSANYIGDLIGQIIGGLMVDNRNWLTVAHMLSVFGFVVFFYWITSTSLSVTHDVRASNVLPGNHYEAAMSIEALKTSDVTNAVHVDVRFTKIPWSAMFWCRPVIALCYCCFSFYLLYYSSPHVTAALGFAAGGSVFIWVLPKMFLVLTGIMSGVVVVCLRRDRSLSCTQVRRLLVCGGLALEALFLTWISNSGSKQLALIFLTMGIGFSGLTLTNLQVNPMDLAPNYASLVAAMTSTVSYMAGFIAKAIFYGTEQGTTSELFKYTFNPLFIALSILCGSAALVYGLMDKGEAQEWDDNVDPTKDPSQFAIKFFAPSSKPPSTTRKSRVDYVNVPTVAVVPQQTDYLEFENPARDV